MSVNWRAAIAAESAQDFPTALLRNLHVSSRFASQQHKLRCRNRQSSIERRASQSLALATLANSKLCCLDFCLEPDLTAMTAAFDFHVAPRPAATRGAIKA